MAVDIVIRGAREHNLRDVSLTLPKNQLIVMTGVSGSGKSSLAFDTLYAEGQRRYVESLSSYARQFLGQMPKPEVDIISGLSPSISIQQKTSSKNPRSTVGTITEVYDYLRVLYARVGQGYCPKCDRPITAQTVDQILESLSRLPAGTRFLVLAPVVQRQKGEYRDLFEDLLKQGFLRARVNGEVVHLTDNLKLDRQMRHTIEVVVDRLVAGDSVRTRLAEALESSFRLAQGSVIIALEDQATAATQPPKRKGKKQAEPTALTGWEAETLFSTHYACTHCNVSYEPPTPQLFSFNSPQGMCTACEGLGQRHDFSLEALIPDAELSLYQGAIPLVGPLKGMGKWRRHMFDGVAAVLEKEQGLKSGSLIKTPWQELPEMVRQAWLYGMGDQHITFSWKHSGGVWKHGGTYPGVVPELLDAYKKAKNPMRRKQLEKSMQVAPCRTCGGARLNPQARAVRLATTNPRWEEITSGAELNETPRTNSRRKGNVAKKPLVPVGTAKPRQLGLTEVCSLTIAEAAEFFRDLELTSTGHLIATEVLKEIRGRLGFLLRCGLEYLTLDRSAPTLSGGESQRIRLAGQIGSGLVGVVYILDEPSIGLHPRDNTKLLQSLLDLRDMGNTVIVVEHDEETIRAADYVVDFGPGPGVRGGEIVARGTVKDIESEPRSVTGGFLIGREAIAIPEQRRTPSDKKLHIRGARHNNLRNLDVEIPLGVFVCVTGVSGSGKSSLINDILWEVLNRDVNEGNGTPGAHDGIDGLKLVDKAIDIDQSPIGRTPRSNPATYIKLFDLIRDLYTQLPDSQLRGYEPGRFSFNVPGGRCEGCEGHGSNKLEMDFLADVWVTCPVCAGHRFNHETLEIRFKGKNIAEVLEMDVQQALVHFENHPKIHKLLKTLADVGLDYLKLGQPSPTLSGGEAQRIKLARELGKRSTGGTIYLLDEPTTGLHFADVKKLLEVLQGLVDQGNTVLVVEHHLDVIKTADWLLDLGPDGGSGGGRMLAEGTPEQIALCRESHTGRALAPLFGMPVHAVEKGVRWQSPVPEATDLLEVDPGKIIVRGASQHNLQGVNLSLQRDEMNVFCGPSGSGKTSLAMDTLYAEGQRRYVESLSAYARQFLGQMPKPKFEQISGLSPAIAIEQKTVGHTPRSTVGTVTEVYDYLRILFARLGQPYCPTCEIPVQTQTADEVIEKILQRPAEQRVLLLAPQEVEVGHSYDQLWGRLKDQGHSRVRINGQTYRLEDVPEMDRRRKHQVEIVIDRTTLDPAQRGRIAESIEKGLDLGRGILLVAQVLENRPETEWPIERFSLHFACEQCGRSFEELTPHSFSFNSPLGWCPSCEGLGVQPGTNLSQLITNEDLSLNAGAIALWPDPRKSALFQKILDALHAHVQLPLDVPFRELTAPQQRIVLYGTGERWLALADGSGMKFQYKGLYPALDEASRVSFVYRQLLSDLTGEVACSTCRGSRLREDASAVRFGGATLQDVSEQPLDQALAFVRGVTLKGEHKRVAGDLLNEVEGRLSFLVDVGLEYLTLSRPLPTLSGGETQRIRLAGQIGRALTGVLYVLDEPTIGLHPRDNARLLKSLLHLRDLGNTLILVEHDREVIEAADRLYDFGPGAGRFGGTVTAEGKPTEIKRSETSLTGKFLSGREEISIPDQRRMQSVATLSPASEPEPFAPPVTGKAAKAKAKAKSAKSAPRVQVNLTKLETPGGGWLEVIGARMHNLRNVDLQIPLGTLTCITGVSGSGKSSLIEQTLAKAVAKRLHRAQEQPGPHTALKGLNLINKVIQVDQQPLGSTPASNPATYTGVFDQIRELFVRLPEAKVRGYRPARFSFNRPGGRCEACEGNGQKCIEMHFLPDVWVECDVCHGQRYNAETLSVKYRGRSISDVLNMSIGQALELFDNVPKIRAPLATLCAIGLDYLTLGQSAPTLSGGEAQRVKLAAELARPQTGKTLYILDEPTTGLHFEDIRKLLKVLDSLVELGNTVVVIEHNVDVIKTADWIVDIGPEAGIGGGWIVAQGTPEDVAAHAAQGPQSSATAPPWHRSYTGEILGPLLREGRRAAREVFDAQEAARKKKGDVEISQIGKGAAMPWQTNGRRWHTVERLSHTGQPCRWEGAALQFVIDTLEETGEWAPVNWNARSVVEVTGREAIGNWFLHALTGDEWLLTLSFRVPPNTFQGETLAAELALTPLDDLDEIQVYGRGARVRVTSVRGAWQDVVITVYQQQEIDTPAFRQFLKRAQAAYLQKTDAFAEGIEDPEPWKTLGPKWHLSRKGFPSTKAASWNLDVLEQLIELLASCLPHSEIDWTGKQQVLIQIRGAKSAWATVTTKRRAAIEVALTNPVGKFALGRIATLGTEREITPGRAGKETIRLKFTTAAEVRNPDLRAFLNDHALSFRAGETGTS